MLVAGGVASAQIPDEFTNLKVLPKDIGKRELVNVMRGYAGALGVRCNFCHPGGDETSLEGMDFATDDNEHKRVTRTMMAMVGEINGRLLPGTGREETMRVTCVTCHRGLKEPESLADVLRETLSEDGIDAAIARYRELREEYYGSGAYNFSPATLNGLAEWLARQGKDFDDAVRLLELNIEMYPDQSRSYFMLGQVHAQSGDKAKAVAAIEKGLELDPDNEYAKGMLARLK